MHKNNKIEVVDLFCGVGGLTYGLQKAGIKVAAGIDNDSTCKHAFEKNNDTKFIDADLTEYNTESVAKLYSKDAIKVLVGCAPCQPFSLHTTKNKDRQNDERWGLLWHFGELIQEILPAIVSMENVRGIVNTDVFEDFIKTLKEHNYHIDYDVVNAADYGAPQSRYRLILLASKLGEIKIPTSSHDKENHRTVKDAIQDMEPLQAGERSTTDPLHTARKLEDTNIKRIKQSKPNGTWLDWDDKLLPNCYRKKSGETYKAVYGRMRWDALSPTITTQFFNYGSGRFGHPVQDRALSIREGALLQTFPKDYDFGEITSTTNISRHIGNAVPPVLGEAIGKTIKEHVIKHHGNG